MSQHQLAARNEQDVQKILLVEDDLTNAEMYTELLRSETHYRLLPMESPAEVLQRLDEVKAFKPTFLLLDYLLPIMTGLELYDYLQQVEELGALPALIVTAGASEEVKQNVGQRNIRVCGKPFELDEFLLIIEQMIAKHSH